LILDGLIFPIHICNFQLELALMVEKLQELHLITGLLDKSTKTEETRQDILV
jgi:hypothetical protein